MHTLSRRAFLLLLASGLSGACSCSRTEEGVPSYRPSGVQSDGSDEYLVGIHPYKHPAALFSAYVPIMQYLQRNIPGAIFKMEASNNYAHFEDKLYSGKFHFALPNPYQALKSVDRGYAIIAKMWPDEDFRGIFVTRTDSGIRNIADLKGTKISFPAETALAGTLMPLRLLFDMGIDVHRDIEKIFVGCQESSILSTYAGRTSVGCTWPIPWKEWLSANPDQAISMHLLWQTDPLPNNAFIARKDVAKGLAAKVSSILKNMRTTQEGRRILENAGFQGFELAGNQTYAPVRRFLALYDRDIGLPQRMK